MVKLPCSIRESLHLDQLALLFEEPLIKNLLQILTLALTWLRCHYEFDSHKDGRYSIYHCICAALTLTFV